MDTVSNFLTRIRNASMAKHSSLDCYSSRLCVGVADVLKKERYIKDYKVVTLGKKKFMRVYLSYNSDNKSNISKITRYSKPSRRVYKPADKIPKVRSGYGLSILSTNKGILSGVEAKKQNVGGEVLCTVW